MRLVTVGAAGIDVVGARSYRGDPTEVERMRKVYRHVIAERALRLDLRWFARQAQTYTSLRTERWRETGKAPPPLMAILIVAEQCNLDCPMCDLPARYRLNPKQASTEQWLAAIDQLVALPVGGVTITGGEPTLRKDIFELVARARAGSLPVTISSNALTLNEQRINALIDADPTNVNVSIDSADAETNDRLRGGRNVLARTLDRIRALTTARARRRASFSLTVVTVLSQSNLDGLDDIFRLAKDAGADRLGFMPIHDIDPPRLTVRKLPSVPGGLGKRLQALSLRHDLPLENSASYLSELDDVVQGGGMSVRCNAGYTSLVVGPDFRLYRCWPFFEIEQPLLEWDPQSQSLARLWNASAYREERKQALDCKQCYWNCHAELSHLVSM